MTYSIVLTTDMDEWKFYGFSTKAGATNFASKVANLYPAVDVTIEEESNA